MNDPITQAKERIVAKFMQASWRDKLERYPDSSNKAHVLAHLKIAVGTMADDLLAAVREEVKNIEVIVGYTPCDRKCAECKAAISSLETLLALTPHEPDHE